MSPDPKMASQANPATAQATTARPGLIQTPVDMSKLETQYTNFFRLSGTSEEIMLEFGLFTQINNAAGPEPVQLTERLVMSVFTAKRLMMSLYRAINQYERTFGAIEIDPQKRMQATPPTSGPTTQKG
jgi:hypothetical protein